MTPTPLLSTRFKYFAAIDLLCSFAEEVLVVAVGWYVYEQTKSAFALGMIGLAGFLPAMLLSLVTGLAADRFDRRNILLFCNVLLAAGAGLLCLITLQPSIVAVYAVIVLMGSGKAFLGPVLKAILPNIVESENLSRALAFTGSTSEAAKLFAPALGGVLYVFGPAVPFTVGGIAFALSALMALGVGPCRPEKGEPLSRVETLLGGNRYIWSKPIVLGAMSLDFVAVLLGGATALLPIFVDQIFHSGPWALGLLRAAPAAGALVMAGLLAMVPLQRRVGRRLLWSVAIYGCATIGFALSTSLVVAFGCMMAIGAADTVSQIIRQSLVQLQTPDSMRGRVSAVHTFVAGGSNEIGQFESGILAAVVGAIPAILIGGVGAVMAALAWAWLFPDIRAADRMTGDPE